VRKGVVIHHNGPPAKCVDQPHDRCERFWRGVRDYHVNTKGWSDIAYSFGVCPHGQMLAGRGWHRSQWANGSDQVGVDDGRDSEWYTVLAFVGGGAYGGFNTGSPEEQVTADMQRGIIEVIRQGRAAKFCDHRVLPHNVFKSKACPGPTLTALAIRLDGGASTPPITNEKEDEMTVLAWCRTTPGSDKGMHCYRITGSTASWCGTHEEIKAAEFFGAKWMGPLDPHVWGSLAVHNGPLHNAGRR
jgi:hypothetical protein